MLELFHPDIAKRSCDDCRKYQYDDSEDGTGEVAMWRGQKMPRQPGTVPCELKAKNDKCRGCPKGHWEDPMELTPRNREAWEHYKQCKATGNFPPDAIVARNAALIAEAEELFSRDLEIKIATIGIGRRAGVM